MSRSLILGSVLLALLLVPAVSVAQEEEPTNYVYGIYYDCDVTRQWIADKIIENAYAPVYDAAVEAGEISGWGWLAHHTGGNWRRVIYYSASSTDALLDALPSINGKVAKESPQAASELGAVCGSHDDYIWQSATGSAGTAVSEDRGKAGFSVYMHCDMTREDRADEIVKEVFAPIYDRHVAEGNIASWGWLQHYVGGKWRRLSTMTAKDHKTLLKVRGEIIAETVEKHEAASDEFSEICGAHADYMWDIQMETP